MNETIEGLCKEAAYHAQQYEEKLAAANLLNSYFEKLAILDMNAQQNLPGVADLIDTSMTPAAKGQLARQYTNASNYIPFNQPNAANIDAMADAMLDLPKQTARANAAESALGNAARTKVNLEGDVDALQQILSERDNAIAGLTDDLNAARGKQNWMQSQIDSLTKAKNNASAQADTLGQELQNSISNRKADAAASRRFKEFAKGQIANAKKYYGIGGVGAGVLGTLGLSKLLGGRPQPGMLEQAGNWVRNNPGMAAGAGLLGAGALAAPFMMGGEKEGSFRGDFNSLTPNEKVAIYRELLTSM